MRVLMILPLLLVAVNGRPQTAASNNSTTTTAAADWKPIETESQSQRLRSEIPVTRTYKTTPNTNAAVQEPSKTTNQLPKSNTTSDIMMDTRTPPKVKQQQQQHKNFEKKKAESEIENSHPGIAVPIDVDAFLETSTPKRAFFYRENKTPTPNSGLSTWILLSGQSTTSKPVRKSTIKTILPTTTTTGRTAIIEKITSSTTEKPVKPTIKLIKPLITTRKPKTTTSLPVTTATKTTPTATTVAPTTFITTTTTKTIDKKETNNRIMTKIKASVLNNAVKNKTVSTMNPPSPTTVSIVTQTSVSTKKTTEKPEVTTIVSKNSEANDLLQPEAKDGAIDLTNEKTTTKRPRRPTTPNKRKKNNNKNRRRKPAAVASEKIDSSNSTKLAIKEKPIGTQIYNYLSREVMPTVGVGLVGLVVTAGLASYFLYPFGGLRRAYDHATDRKDYFYDEYSNGGVAEEELIGKVIAGMPDNSEYGSNTNAYRTPLARKDAYKNEVNYNYRASDNYYQYPYNEYQTVSVGSKIGYSRDVMEQQKETGYTVDDGESEKKQFVVGNVPKEFDQPATPVTVPEHGPRSLKIRRRRFAKNEKDNEILDFYETSKNKVKPYIRQKSTTSTTTTFAPATEKADITTTEEILTTEDTIVFHPEQPSIFTFLRNLLELKVRLGLDFLLKTTDSFSNYLRGVQERVNTALRDDRH